MWFVGLDVHKQTSSVCILDENGKVVKRAQFKGCFKGVFEWLRDLKEQFAICYEASCGYGYLHDQLRRISGRVMVAHPGQLRLIFRSKKKNDRVDAKKLATLLFLDQVPTVYVPSLDVRSWRSLIQHRHVMIGKRTRAKNGLRALFRAYGVEVVSGPRLWTGRGLITAANTDLPTTQAALQRDLLLEEVRTLTGQLKRVENELASIAKQHSGVRLLMTIPGIGIRTAEAVVAYIDDPSRFRRNKCLGAYFGLVPCQDESAGKDRLGHITREGPAVVRKLLTEASWQGIRRNAHIRAYFERMQGGNPKRKKIAIVATAHYLLRVMHAMLCTGEAWREQRPRTEAA
jgi:transposase